MKPSDIIDKLGNRQKGAIATITKFSQQPTLKSAGDVVVEKRSIFQMRLGHDYENQASTKEKREEGKERGSSWHVPAPELDGDKNLLCKHKHNGKVYLKGQPNPNPKAPRSAQWFLDGKPVEKSEVESMLKKKSPPSDYMVVKSEDIENIA